MSKRCGYSILAFTLGAIFGASLALILTPWRGEEVRDRLSRVPAERKLERVRKKLEKLEERINKQLQDSKDLSDTGEQATQKED